MLNSAYKLNPAYKVFLKTLANENRLRIINLLRKNHKCVSEICEELHLNQTTVSHSLQRLEYCGFVLREKKGKYRYYRLNQRSIKPMMNLIDAHIQEYCEKILRRKQK